MTSDKETYEAREEGGRFHRGRSLLFTLAGCGDDGETEAAQAEQTASNGEVFNDADVDFATAMIPHHAQALVMVDLTLGRELSPEVQQLTEDIQAAQGPEIELMVDWLTQWDQPVPETMRDHTNAEDHGVEWPRHGRQRHGYARDDDR